jgi:hypothetical protein
LFQAREAALMAAAQRGGRPRTNRFIPAKLDCAYWIT